MPPKGQHVTLSLSILVRLVLRKYPTLYEPGISKNNSNLKALSAGLCHGSESHDAIQYYWSYRFDGRRAAIGGQLYMLIYLKRDRRDGSMRGAFFSRMCIYLPLLRLVVSPFGRIVSIAGSNFQQVVYLVFSSEQFHSLSTPQRCRHVRHQHIPYIGYILDINIIIYVNSSELEIYKCHQIKENNDLRKLQYVLRQR